MANESGNSEPVEQATEALRSPFCASLRSKKFFMSASLPTEAADYLDGSNHCWCRETQQAIGPDGGMAQPDHCVAGRSCYSSAFEV
jgi:hypothetical protein